MLLCLDYYFHVASFYFFKRFICILCAEMLCLYVWCPQNPEEDIWSLGTGVKDVSEPSCGC